MHPVLRPFQRQLKSDVLAAWQAGAVNVMAVSATGSGKTVVLSDFMRENDGANAAITHRQELVSQMSLALAKNGGRRRGGGPGGGARAGRRGRGGERGERY